MKGKMRMKIKGNMDAKSMMKQMDSIDMPMKMKIPKKHKNPSLKYISGKKGDITME